MPLDARFTHLPALAGEARTPDEGGGARTGAGNPFADLLDELGRGTGTTGAAVPEPTGPVGKEGAAGASAPTPEGAIAPAEDAAEGGTDLSRLIARALSRSGGPAHTSVRPSLALAPSRADKPQAAGSTAPDTAQAAPAPVEERPSSACDSAQPAQLIVAEGSEPDMHGADRDAAEVEAARIEVAGEEGAGPGTAALEAAGMAALFVCVAPPSAGRAHGTHPHDPEPDARGAPQAGALEAHAPHEDTAREAPRLVAKVLDVQTHFAPIRSLVSAPGRTDAPLETNRPETVRIDWTDEAIVAARPPSVSPDLHLTAPLPAATPKPAGAPAPLPEARTEPLLASPRMTDTATGGTVLVPAPPASGTQPPAAPTRASQAPAAPVAAPSAAAAREGTYAPGPAEPEAAAFAAMSTPDRTARRADPAGAKPSENGRAPEASPLVRPSEAPPAGRPADGRASGREDRRDERAAPAPTEAGAGRAASSPAAPAGSPMTAATPPATAAVGGAISEVASRLVRANSGTDLTAAPRPGDPVRIMEIALTPEGLGKVTVRLRLTSDGLEVRVRASDAGTAALLQQDKAQLAGILREFGCSEDRMEVSGPDGGTIGAGTGPDLRAASSPSSDENGSDSQRGQQGDRSQGGFQGGSQGGSGRNEGRHDDQGSRNPARGANRDPGFDAGFDAGLLDG